jgi:hypothetical protein
VADEETTNGLAALRSKVERRSRQVPPPRTAAAPLPATESGNAQEGGEIVGESASIEAAPTPPAPRTRPRRSPAPPVQAGERHPQTSPDEPSANLAIRVRRSLDERLNELIFDLRRDGIKTSKVELVEMLLWELPPRPGASLTDRLASFRRAAPRTRELG